jgi:hypothetical protein
MQGATPQELPVLKGGMRVLVTDLLTKGSYQINVGLFLLLVLGIVFVEQIPSSIRGFLSGLFGRILLFGGVLLITEYYSWSIGLLATLFALLLITKHSRNLLEGFQPDAFTFQLIQDKKKWFVEEVLKENPLGITDEKVSTLPVQDRNEEYEKQASSVQDSRSQNNSIM